MIDFSTITDIATLGFVIKAVWMLSRITVKVEVLKARVSHLEACCPNFISSK